MERLGSLRAEQRLADSRADQLTVKAIAEIAHGLGKSTIAEFVGDEQTVELLREYGVAFIQGFLIGRPKPVPSLVGDW